MDFLEKVKKTACCHRLFSSGDKVIVGVSGGPDSMALLNALNALKHSFNIRLYVAHLNHGLRKTARLDQKFVQRAAARLQLPFIARTVSLRKHKKGSIEELAREIRRKFLIETAQKNKAHVIALGHTQDDLAETVLMRLLRGTGLLGMRAILPKREMQGLLFVRPLIDMRRKEIIYFLNKKKVAYRTDATNKQKIFFRNKIRLELLPYLEKRYNPNIREILAKFSQTASSDYEYLEQEGKKVFRSLNQGGRHNAVRAALNINRAKKLHLSQLRMILRMAIEKIQGDTRKLTLSHIREIEDLLVNRPVHSIVQLPNKTTVLKENKYLIFYRRKP